MNFKRTFTFKSISLITLIAFVFVSFAYYTPAYADCWNDACNKTATGGPKTSPNALGQGHNILGSTVGGDPVNLTTGNYIYENIDLAIPARGIPIEFKRFYNSLDEYDGPFGIGWSHSYNTFLIETGDADGSYVIRRTPDGSKEKFTKNPDDSYTSPPGVFDTLTKNAQGYLITTKHKIAYQFNSSGYLSSITDRNGNQVLLTYDPATGVLTTITDALNRQVTLEYTPQRKVFKLKDFTGRTWTYGYLNGDLSTVTAPATADFPQGTTTTYAYTNHKLDSITDAKQQTYINIFYDSEGKVERTVLGAATYAFYYSPACTTLYDPKNNRVEYELNQDGTVSKKNVYIPNTILYNSYEYNSDKLITNITYPKGNSAHFTYDSKGNLLEIRRRPNPNTEPLPDDIVSTFTYEPRYNFIKTQTDPRGKVTTYYYDYEEATLGDLNSDGITDQDKGNLVKISYPEVNSQIPQIKFTYNSYGQVSLVTDPNNNFTKYEYYPDTGYLFKVINAYISLNLASEFTYDPVGNIRAVKDPKGNITTFEYDAHNNLTKSISASPFNYQTIYKYDANDNLRQIDRETRIPANPWFTTIYAYDFMDRLETVKDELNNVTTFGYDPNGNRSSILDAESNTTTYEYNERNLLWKVTDAESHMTEYTYDANGNLYQLKDPNTNTTTYLYDDFDRLKTTVYPDTLTEEYTYDANSNLKTKKDLKDQTIIYDYDNLNRLDLKTYPGSTTVDYVYDLGSRLTDVIDQTGTIHFDHDTANRLQSVTYPGSKTISYQYDENSNRKRLTYPDLTYITYDYDQLNRLTYVKDQPGSTIAHYTYDALSRRTQTDIANNTQAIYAYDDINRLTSLVNKINGGANISSFSYPLYDDVGNRKEMATPGGTHSYTYDKTYQLKTVDYPAASGLPDTTYNYDSASNRTSVVNGPTTTYIPNNLNQYTSVGGVSYDYDDNGSLTSDGTLAYAYDYENRLISANKAGMSAVYKYDPFGRRIEKEVNTTVTKFLYDGDQVICEYNDSGTLTAKYTYGPGIDEPIKLEKGGQTYYYHYDGLGSVTNLTDSSGATVESYSYDVFGNPDSTSVLGNRFMFTGREYDTETGLYYYRARFYDPKIGRFLQRDPVGYSDSTNLYQYCNNNPVNWIDPFGLEKQKNKPWWEKLEEGYYFGTYIGLDSTSYYAELEVATGNRLWGIPGTFAGLWTPETWMTTAQVLLFAYNINLYINRPYFQYYPKGSEAYRSPYLTRGRGWRAPYKVGEEAAEKLSLPPHNPGTAVRQIKPNPFRYIEGPKRIPGNFGRSGGGTQYTLQ